MVDAASSVEWRVVQGYPGYEVSSEGQIRRTLAAYNFRRWPAGTVISQRPANSKIKYLNVALFDDARKMHSVLVHQVVCRAFHGDPPSEKHEVAHGDGNPQNCRSDNLRWATRKENHADKIAHGTQQIGSKGSKAKLTDSDVLDIKRRLRSGETGRSIARLYKVTPTCISYINVGHTWPHIRL